MTDDALADFERTEFTADGRTAPVYRIGTGPAVIVMSEMPGITPRVADFARTVAGIGCTAIVPHLFGVDGKDPSTAPLGVIGTLSTLTRAMVPA
ncbi:MAG: dienelactone hydrolase, partial [Rhodococcus sp. (in: high G+C Gram-positive bacteria)]